MTARAFPFISTDFDGAVEYTRLSETTIRAAMNSGELTPHYVGRKPVFRAEDLDEWVRSLPTERDA